MTSVHGRLRRVLVTLGVLAAAGALPHPVAAQSAPASFNPLVNVSNSAAQVSDRAAIALDGSTTYVAWREQTPVGPQVRLRRSTNGGVTFIDGATGRLVASVDEAEPVFAVRIAAAGTQVYVLYTSGVEPRLAKARLARSVDGGATFSAPVTLAETPEAGGTAFADLAIDGNGTLHIVLESRDADEDIFHVSSSDQGVTFSPAMPLAPSAAPSARPAIAARGLQIAVVWEETLADAGGEAGDIAFVSSSDGGVTFGAMVNLSESAVDSHAPAVAVGNGIHALWTEGTGVTMRTSLDGIAFTPAQLVGAAAEGETIAGAAVASSVNTVHVSWITADADGLNGPFYRRSTDGTATFAPAQDLRGAAAGKPFGVPAIGAGTIARVVWSHSPSGFEADADVHAAIAANCAVTWKAAVSGNWNDATKWSPAVIPGVGSSACITADGAPYTVTVPAAQNAGELTIGHATSEHRPTVRITGGLTIGTSLVNSGEITFGTNGQLASAAGAIVISERGRLITAAGAPGSINGSAVNYGVVDLGANLTISGNLRTFTNFGSFTVRPGAATPFGGSFVFNQNGGTLTVEGTMEFSAEFSTAGDTLNFNDGIVEGVVIIQGHSRLNIGAGSVGKGTFQFERNVSFGVSSGGHLSGNIAPLQTLRLMGTAGGSAQVNIAAGLTNAGTIEMTASATNAGAVVMAIQGGTVVNTGTLSIQRAGDVAVGRIDGSLENRGTFDIQDELTFGTNGRFTNLGTMTVGADAALTFGGSYVFNQNGGVLRNLGRIELSGEFSTAGDTFNFNDGTVEGEVIIQGHSRLNIGPGSIGAGMFVFERNVIFGVSSGGSLSGDIAAAQTVRLRGTVGGSAQANVAVGFTNFGTLMLESTAPTAGGAALVLTAGTVINLGSLIVAEMLPGKVLRGHLENRGVMTVMAPLSLQLANGTFNNFGDVTVGAPGKITCAANTAITQHAGTMTLDGPIELSTEFSTAPDLFTFAGGNIVGAAGVHLMSTSRLTIAPSAADGAGRFVYRAPNNGGGTITGAIGPLMTVRAQGSSVTAANGLINAGTIVVTQEPGNTVGGVNVTAGVLVNTGTITIEPVATVAPLNAVVQNHGRITINDTINLSRANASHVNDGVFEIAAGNTVTLTGNGTFRNAAPGTIVGNGTLIVANGSILAGVGSFGVNVNNSGRFRPGVSPGIVDITGNYTQAATGRLEIELAGFGPGAPFDQVNVSGVATLAGVLEVFIVAGSCIEGSYPFMSYASVAGDFASKLGLTPGGGRTLTANRGANVYALNVAGPPCNQAPVANGDAYQINQGTVLNVAAPGVLANDTDAQNDALTAALVSGPANGALNLNADGSFVYTPQLQFAGIDTFTYTAGDGAAQSGVATVTITVTGETDAPVTFAALSSPANAHGWHAGAVTVTLQSGDGPNGSGVKHIAVTIEGSAPQIVDGATAVIELAHEGAHTIRYFAVDNAGNIEAERELTVRIDMTPPTASVDRTLANEHGWNNTDVTVSFNAGDALSGVDGATAAVVIRTEEGADQGATATFMDLAGNTATFSVGAIHIDKTSPLVTGERQTAPNQAGWNNGPVLVSFVATDALSGVAGDSSAAVTIDGEGADQTASALFTDRAGNSASAMVAGISIDLTPPTIVGAPDREPNADGIYTAPVEITFSCSDALSGVAGCVPASALISEEGENLSRTGVATDRAGNIAQATVGAIHVDIADTTPMTCSASTQTLWPPNHKLVPVQTAVTVTNAIGATAVTLVRASSSEADNGLEDGDTAGDIQGFIVGTADTSGLLRAERSGRGTGRIYSLLYEVADDAGRTATCTAVITVPHDKGGGRK